MADLSSNAGKPVTKLALILISTATATLVITVAKFALSYISTLASFHGIWVVAQLIILLVWKLSAKKREQDQQHEDDFFQPLVHVHDSFENIAAVLDLPVAEAAIPPAKAADDEVKEAMEPRNVVKETIKQLSSIEKHDSIDDTWKDVMGGGVSPVSPLLRKCETWEGQTMVVALKRQKPVEWRPELRKSATFREAANGGTGTEGTARRARVVGKPETKKSATFREGKETGEGWRGREAVVMGNDELFGRVEAFIKMHHDNLRMQRQESVEQRRFTGLVSTVY